VPSTSTDAGNTPKPNGLFILVDQHNAKVLGHKGHADVKTPALDRLAQEGVRFDNAITRVPCLWRWPGHFKAGHVATELVESVDLVNTLCALAGLERLETVEGKDISSLLRGERGDVRRVAVTEFPWRILLEG
jgi:arylsulfatase A-like enzyme